MKKRNGKSRSLDPTDPLLDPLVSPLAPQSFTCENSQREEKGIGRGKRKRN